MTLSETPQNPPSDKPEKALAEQQEVVIAGIAFRQICSSSPTPCPVRLSPQCSMELSFDLRLP